MKKQQRLITAATAPERTVLLWTTLPASGRTPADPAILSLSLYLTPRLPPGAAIGDTALAEWPRLLAQARDSFVANFGTAPDQAITCFVPANAPALDAELWKALFPPHLRAPQYKVLAGERPTIKHYPVAAACQVVESIHRRHARDLETAKDRLAVLSVLDGPDFAAVRDAKWTDPLPMQQAFYEGLRPTVPTSSVKAADEELDVYSRFSVLASHPEILRRLGLVIDLELRGQRLDADGRIRVFPTFPAPTGRPWVNVAPWTEYELRDRPVRTFSARPSPGGELERGLVQLSTSYATTMFDIESGGLQLTGMFRALRARVSVPRPTKDDERVGLPPLKSAGVSLIRRDRHEVLKRALDAALGPSDVSTDKAAAGHEAELDAQLRANPNKELVLWDAKKLFLDDVLRGYRVDALGAEGEWRSLCKRISTYESPPTMVGPPVRIRDVREESTVSMTTSRPPDRKDSVYLHEVVVRWEGWSLAVPRPGKPVPQRTTESGEPPPQLLTVVKDTNGNPLSKVDGDLSSLRIGALARLRLRAVDLAGNGVTVDQASRLQQGDAQLAARTTTGADRYLRFEPLAPPEIYPAVEVRKDPDLDRVERQELPVTELVIHSKGGLDNTVPLAKEASYHVVPPAIGLGLADAHGLFDGNPASSYQWLKEVQKRAKEKEYNEYFSLAKLPFIGDPAATQASFVNLPGWPRDKHFKMYFNADGDIQRPFILKLREGTNNPIITHNEEGEPELAVSLPASCVATVRLSSALLEKDDPRRLTAREREKLRAFASWKWIDGSEPLEALALAGRHEQLTPGRAIRLVHAVERPIHTADFENTQTGSPIRIVRVAGETAVWLEGRFLVHAASTGKIEVAATWSDRVYDESVVPAGNHAFDKDVERPAQCAALDPRKPLSYGRRKHQLPDTKRRKVTYTPHAVSAFVKYFRVDASDSLDRFRILGMPVVCDIPSSARPDPVTVLRVVPTFEWERPQTPARTWSRRRLGRGLRLYLAPTWYSSGDEEKLAVIVSRERDASGLVPAADIPFSTQWGADPIWGVTLGASANPAPPVPEPNDLDGKWFFNLPLAEGKGRFDVCTYTPTYDAATKLFYCDIVVKTSRYFPFVKLVVARFQDHSVNEGLKLSPVTRTDILQLTPDRTANLTRSGRTVSVVVIGIGPDPAVPVSLEHRVEAFIQIRKQRRPDDLGWEVVASSKRVLGDSPNNGDERVWSTGDNPIELSTLDDQTYAEARIAIREVEAQGARERVVYLETAPIP